MSGNNRSTKLPTQNFVNPAVAGSKVQQLNYSNFVNFLNSFDMTQMTRDDVLEHLYVMEPEVSSAIDSFALMVREAFQYFESISDAELDNMPDTLQIDNNTTLDFSKSKKNLSLEMVDVANKLAKELNIKDLFETYAAILHLHGNLFLRINPDNTLTVLPNDRVTIVDKPEIINSMGNINLGYKALITQPNILILDEGLETQQIIQKSNFMILKFRDTPIYVEDSKGRMTYGIYGVSPLRRSIIPVWYRRVLMANDATWRAKSQPKLDVSISGESFSTSQYVGSPETRMQKAVADAANAVQAEALNLENSNPDQAFIHLDTTTYGYVEPKAATFLEANELINQTTDSIFAAINLPKSIILGESTSNYAGELAVYSYASLKVKQAAEKISRVILPIIKERLLIINNQYPVEWLECKISYNMSDSPLELAKVSQIKASMGAYTDDEVRAMNNDKPLTQEQRSKGTILNDPRLALALKMSATKQPGQSNGQNSDGSVNYRDTPRSQLKQPTDSAQAVLNKQNKKLNINE